MHWWMSESLLLSVTTQIYDLCTNEDGIILESIFCTLFGNSSNFDYALSLTAWVESMPHTECTYLKTFTKG